MNFESKLVNAENLIDKSTGAVNVPIYQTSTFHQFDIENFGEYDYSRSKNPTRSALEEVLKDIENGKYAFAFSSGMAAICSVLSIFNAGDHIIVSGDVYGGTYRAITKFFSRFNIEFSFVDLSNLSNIKDVLKKNTKGIYIETPSNPLLKITDIRQVVKIAKRNKLLTIADNTFMSPYLLRPLELGVDIVVSSATKFLGGHSDIIAGVAATRDENLAKEIYNVQNTFGAILSPNDSFLLLRGIKTLKVRLDKATSNALELSKYLKTLDKVSKVYYPGLKEHKGYEIHKSQAKNGGAVVCFEFKNREDTIDFLNNIKGVLVSVSLGGVETIVSYPVKMSHAAIPKDEREALGIKDTLVRVSLGLEDINDIIYNFDKAINK
ncbi:MAG: trans-sulfuration enzyme family protein [Clostridium chrysemydis]|uniref:trans-sulfuration enzyme family protein n=1 Tax=Clostridium chrysemydis TaxID=2665504 RepID=UPI003F2A7053